MNPPITPESSQPAGPIDAEKIISGTSSLIDDLASQRDGREKYLDILRATIEQARDAKAGAMVSGPGTMDSQASRPLILHIDDDRGTLDLVSQILTDANYRVVTAQSGFDGIDQFRRRPHDFSLVVMDLTMPFMDGEETFGRLREIRPDVPVILATGFIQEERLTHLRNIGLAGFLRKPIPPDEIVTIVRSILESVRFSGGSSGPGRISIPI